MTYKIEISMITNLYRNKQKAVLYAIYNGLFLGHQLVLIPEGGVWEGTWEGYIYSIYLE